MIKNTKMRQLENYKGITLIALVITIIVLIIFAGVGITTLTGDNGILKQLFKAKEQLRIGEEEEKLILAISQLQIEKKNKLELNQLNEIKDKDIKVETVGGKVNIYNEEQKKYAICSVGEYQFKVYEDFKIELLGDVLEEDKEVPIDESAYIQDGLIVLYDGKNNTGNGHDNTVGTWTNLAKDTLGTNNGTLMNTDFTETSGWTENSLILDGNNDWVKMQYLDYSNMTVEIVAKPLNIDTSKMQYYISNCQSGGVEIIKNQNNYNTGDFFINGGYREVTSEESIRSGQIYSMSTSYDGEKIYFRENSKTYNTEIKGTNTGPYNSVFVIGTNPNGNVEDLGPLEARFNLEVYSVRIYNRSLTEQERQHNYQIDKQRFCIQ